MKSRQFASLLLLASLVSSCALPSIEIQRPQVTKNPTADPAVPQQNALKIELQVAGISPAIDPTGKTIAFASDGGYIWTIDIDGNNLQQLSKFGRDNYPSWSPDGRKIAFQSCGQARRNSGAVRHSPMPLECSIWTIERDGQNPHRVQATSYYRDRKYPQWSPDGRSILWSQQDGIWIANADGTNDFAFTPVSDRPQQIVGWSLDGMTMYYSGGGLRRRSSTSTPTPTPTPTPADGLGDRYWQIGRDGKNARPIDLKTQQSLQPSDGKYRYDCSTEMDILRFDRRGQKSIVPRPQSGATLTRECLISSDRTKLVVGIVGKGGGRNFIYVLDLSSQP